jgi:hypothetical protein
MALQSINPFRWPDGHTLGGYNSVSATLSSITLNATNDKVAWVLTAEEARTLTAIRFRVGTVTTGATMTVAIEDIGTDGKPVLTTPTVLASGTVAVSGSNTWQSVTGLSLAISKEQRFALTIAYSSGSTPNFPVQAYAFTQIDNLAGLASHGWLSDAGGAYAQQGNQPQLFAILEDSNGPYYQPGLLPLDGALTLRAFNNTSTPDEYALRFQVPFRCRVRGIVAEMFNVAAGADFKAYLWAASGSTVVADALAGTATAVDGDAIISAAADGIWRIPFSAAYVLVPGVTYYAGIKAETANNIGLGLFLVPSGVTGAKAAMYGGAQCYLGTRSWTGGPESTGDFSDDATKVPMISLLIDQLDDGRGARPTLMIGGL